jgi:hypothetical protein
VIDNHQLRPKNLDPEFEAKTAEFAPGALPSPDSETPRRQPEAKPQAARDSKLVRAAQEVLGQVRQAVVAGRHPAAEAAAADASSHIPQPAPRTRLAWQETLTFADNESIASILSKMEHVPSREIAILAPPHLRVFRNPVSMRLLQRKAQDLGLDVTIISQDEMTRQLCAEIGFGCYGEEKGFRRENSRPRHLEMALPPTRLRWVSVAAGGCLLALVFFVGWFVLPAASITVTPASTALAIDVPVVADSTVNTVDLAAGKIPAHVVTSGDVEGSTTVSASGQRDVPNQAARGFVTFTNLTGQPVSVPKNTVLLAGKVAFFTISDTQVSPSLKIGDTPIPGSGSASVQAADPGDAGNVPVGAITAVQGALGSQVSVINHSATTGGSNKKATYLSSDDQAKAKQALLDELRQQGLDKIRGQIARNETFLPSPDSAGEGAVEELTYAESPEQVTGQTTLHMKLLVRGLTFQGDDVNQVVAQAMDSAARKAGDARLADAPLAIDPPAVLSNDGATIKLQVHTTGRMSTPLKSSALADQVHGLNAAAARSRLAQDPGVGQADVQLWPAWATKVPSFSWRIQTTVASPPN